MNSDLKKRLSELITAHGADLLTPEEHAELQSHLRNDKEARRWWFVHQDVEMGLRAQVAAGPLTASKARVMLPWLSWRPLAAAAAGIVLGMACASMAWAYAGGRASEIVARVIALTDGDFEGAANPAPAGVPKVFGVWSGDFSRSAGAEQGIQPKSGQRMLRILRSDSQNDPPSFTSHGGDMMQLVDLHQWREAFAPGDAVLEVEASANMVRPQPGEAFSFAVSVSAFSGRPSDLASSHTELEQTMLGSALKRVPLDLKPGTWQTATARLLLPPDADFALVKLTMTRVKPRPEGHAEFAGHYVDDVRLVLKSTANRSMHAVVH